MTSIFHTGIQLKHKFITAGPTGLTRRRVGGEKGRQEAAWREEGSEETVLRYN